MGTRLRTRHNPHLGEFGEEVGNCRLTDFADQSSERAWHSAGKTFGAAALAGGLRIEDLRRFSAYSDIAIGSARLFSIRVPENFDWPYIRSNIADFWRHWHMPLTRWLTDYIYIPLGGSRVIAPRVYPNLLVTMLISGLWHGAGLTFLVWGLWHGALLCIHRLWRQFHGEPSPSRVLRWGSTALTLVAVNAGWAFFCMDLHTTMIFYRRLFVG